MAKRRKKTADLDYWLEGAARPVFVVDAERRVRAFNSGFQVLTGWQKGEVVGETCHYGSVSETAGAAALAASLCPPPEVFAGAEASVPGHLIHREGHAIPRLLHFFPLWDENDRLTGVLGIVSPLPAPQAAGEVSPARKLHAELAAVRAGLRSRFGSNRLVARSIAMRRVLAQVELAQSCDAPVLISGPVGSGKEQLARVIHFGGTGKGSFVPLDCRRLAPEELDRVWNRLLDSVQAAPGESGTSGQTSGTVFLADLEFLPRDLQERLASFFSSADGKRPPVRLISATVVALPELSTVHQMRPDFLAMASALSIEVPALSERPEDLPLLAQHFLEEINCQEPKQIGGFEEEIWPLLTRYEWPGNLDELAAVVREAHAHATEAVVRLHDLPFRFRNALAAQELPPPPEPPPMLLDPLLTKVESRLISLALTRSRNNKSRAAEILGINRARLLRRIEQLKITEPTATGAEPAPPELPPDDEVDAAIDEQTQP